MKRKSRKSRKANGNGSGKHTKRAKQHRTQKQHRIEAIPSGYHAVTPYLSVRGAAEAIEFYKKAFDAKEMVRMPGPNGKLGHCELQIGDSRIMLSDEHWDMQFLSPATRGGTTVEMYLYVKDADKVVERAEEAGAQVVRPVEVQFYGDRTGTVKDPFGHCWHVATHVEDIPMSELQKKAEEMAAGASGVGPTS